MKTATKPAFWVTNASPRNVTLADLALNIKAFTTVNLLDDRHYSYTLEQLLKSKETGSLFNKRDKIVVRNQPPPSAHKNKMPFLQEAAIPSRQRSLFSIKETEYDELNISDDKDIQKKLDEEFAKESVEMLETNNPNTTAKKV